jgi:hypothetical protein
MTAKRPHYAENCASSMCGMSTGLVLGKKITTDHGHETKDINVHTSKQMNKIRTNPN